jgi:hypothetical protein
MQEDNVMVLSFNVRGHYEHRAFRCVNLNMLMRTNFSNASFAFVLDLNLRRNEYVLGRRINCAILNEFAGLHGHPFPLKLKLNCTEIMLEMLKINRL